MQSVVDRTGVPADTIRSWERRHGFPAPARDAQNQRLYSEHDIQAILGLKERTARGIPVKEALRLLPDQGRGNLPSDVVTSAHEAESTPTLASRSLPPVVERLVDVLLQFDGAAARTLLQVEMTTRSPESVAFESILPAIERLALETDAGGTFGREFMRRILVSLFNATDPDTGRDRVVIARIPPVNGSRDGLLALAHAIALSRAGFAVVWLDGAADPADIQHVISLLHPLAVLLVTDDAEDTGTAERWWKLLNELPSLRTWSGRRLIASRRQPALSGAPDSDDPRWMPPEPDAARLLLESNALNNRDTIKIVSDQ